MKRKLALFMVLAMIVSLVPMNVFAASTNKVDSVKVIKDGEPGTAVLTFDEESVADFKSGESFQLTLHNADVVSTTAGTGLTVVSQTDNSVILAFTSAVSSTQDDTPTLTLGYEVTEEANVTVDIDSLGSGVSDQTGLVIAKGAAGGSVTTIAKVETIGEGSAEAIANITIKETSVASWATGDKVKIKLPNNFEWAASSYTAVGFSGVTAGVVGNANKAITNVNDARELLVTISSPDSGTRGGIILQGLTVKVKSDAKVGDVNATVSNVSGDFTNETVKVAVYSDYGVTVELDKETIPTIYSGMVDPDVEPISDDAKLQKIVIEEDVVGSLLVSRKFKVEFPEGVKVMGCTMTDGSLTVTPAVTDYVDDDSNSAEFTVSQGATTTGKIELTFYVSVEADFSGDIKATISGKALPTTYSLVAGKAVKRATYTVKPVDVRLGVQDQAMGDIVITEPEAGHWATNEVIVVDLPKGFEMEDDATFKVTKGDLEIKGAETNDNGDLEFTVDSDSSVASEVTISGGTVNLERTLAEGDYKINVGGGIDTTDSDNNSLIKNFIEDEDNAQFETAYVGSQVAFHVITPADANTKAGEKVVFTIGSTEYTVGANKLTADVAPYIDANGRTMLPLRVLANALGVVDTNILWNDADRSVTIFKGDRVVKVVIGQSFISVNGTAVPMDTVAVIKDGRTMLPLRAIGTALGASIAWDEATKTVTIN